MHFLGRVETPAVQDNLVQDGKEQIVSLARVGAERYFRIRPTADT